MAGLACRAVLARRYRHACRHGMAQGVAAQDELTQRRSWHRAPTRWRLKKRNVHQSGLRLYALTLAGGAAAGAVARALARVALPRHMSAAAAASASNATPPSTGPMMSTASTESDESLSASSGGGARGDEGDAAAAAAVMVGRAPGATTLAFGGELGRSGEVAAGVLCRRRHQVDVVVVAVLEAQLVAHGNAIRAGTRRHGRPKGAGADGHGGRGGRERGGGRRDSGHRLDCDAQRGGGVGSSAEAGGERGLHRASSRGGGDGDGGGDEHAAGSDGEGDGRGVDSGGGGDQAAERGLLGCVKIGHAAAGRQREHDRSRRRWRRRRRRRRSGGRRAWHVAVVAAEAGGGAVAGVALLLVVDARAAVTARVDGQAGVAPAAAEQQRVEVDAAALERAGAGVDADRVAE
eukprot:scaffold40165_cov60-Phaeocystis_antarctica.AAC.8